MQIIRSHSGKLFSKISPSNGMGVPYVVENVIYIQLINKISLSDRLQNFKTFSPFV